MTIWPRLTVVIAVVCLLTGCTAAIVVSAVNSAVNVYQHNKTSKELEAIREEIRRLRGEVSNVDVP